jgi:hypothetical protein
MKDGLPVFRWRDGRLEHLDGCHYPGSFKFRSLTQQTQMITGAALTDLELNAFQGVVSGGLTHETRFVTEVVLVGEMRSPTEHPDVGHLAGDLSCRGATHVATVVKTGAFESFDLNETQGGVGVGLGPVGARASHARSNAILDKSGKLENCDHP